MSGIERVGAHGPGRVTEEHVLAAALFVAEAEERASAKASSSWPCREYCISACAVGRSPVLVQSATWRVAATRAIVSAARIASAA